MPHNAQRWRWNDAELWKNHAKEFLGETGHLKNHKVIIAFNRWVNDPAYREEIASILGLRFTNQGINDVWHIGSTFDVKKFDGVVRKMDTSGRWKHAVSTPEFLDIFRDNEIIQLSQQVFGATQADNYILQTLAGSL